MILPEPSPDGPPLVSSPALLPEVQTTLPPWALKCMTLFPKYGVIGGELSWGWLLNAFHDYEGRSLLSWGTLRPGQRVLSQRTGGVEG